MPPKRRRVAHTPLIAAGVFLGLAACTGLGPSSPAPFLTATLPPPVVGYATATRNASVTPAQVAQANTATLTHTPTGSATFTAAAPVLPSAATTIQSAIGQAVVAQEGTGDVNRTATLSEIVAQVVARLSEQEGFGAAAEGQVLGLGGQVQTGAASRVRIDLSDETILRLDQNSFFTVTALEPTGATPFARLFLSIGRIFSVLKGPGTLEIETPVGIASVRGSAMVTWYDPTTEIFTMGCGAGDCTLQPFLTDGSTLTFTVPVGELGAIVGAGNVPTSAGPLPLHFVLEWLSLAAEAEPELRPLLTQVAGTATAHAATQTAQPTTAATSAPAPDTSPPPTVTKVNSTNATADNEITAGEETSTHITHLLVTFSEAMNDPAGNADAADVTNPDNYLLAKAGADGTRDTTTCAAGIAGDDVQETITSVSYDAATNTADLVLNSTAGLPDNKYRLLVCGSTSVADAAGNKLDGNNDGTGGDDFTRDFQVIIEVSTTTDEINTNGSCSLREAIINANVDDKTGSADCIGGDGDDVIKLPAGTYTLTKTGANEDAAATGDLDISDDLEINGANTSTTIVQGATSLAGASDRVFDIFGPATVTMTDLTIRYGSAPNDTGGGGIQNFNKLNLNRVAVTSNKAAGSTTGNGGGILNASGVALNITNSTISDNIAETNGGGILNSQGTAVIINSTISGNKANNDGGGVANEGSTADTTITFSTIAGNTADDDANTAGAGGGVANTGAGTMTVKNTLIADNIDKSPSNPDCTGTLNSNDYNLIEDTSGCTITGTTKNNVTGQDPTLSALANNGGSTDTHALGAGSLALDQIPYGTNGCGTTYTTDQRSVSRPQNTKCDIGAFERQ